MRITQRTPVLVIEEGAATGAILGSVLTLVGIAGLAIGWFDGRTMFLVLSPVFLLYGLKMLLFGKTSTHRFDRGERAITVESANRFGASRRQLRFEEIADIAVEEIRDARAAPSYYVYYVTTQGERVRWAETFDGSKDNTMECVDAARASLGLASTTGSQ